MDNEVSRTGVEKKFFDLSLEVTEQEGFDLYDLEYINGQKLLRIFIEHKDKKTIDIQDCVKVDKALNPHFEELDWIPEDVAVEVSSPGVYRKIRTLNHLESAVGEDILLQISGRLKQDEIEGLPKSLNGQNKLRGKLAEASEESIKLNIENFELNINIKDIKKANVDPDFASLSGRES